MRLMNVNKNWIIGQRNSRVFIRSAMTVYIFYQLSKYGKRTRNFLRRFSFNFIFCFQRFRGVFEVESVQILI